MSQEKTATAIATIVFTIGNGQQASITTSFPAHWSAGRNWLSFGASHFVRLHRDTPGLISANIEYVE